MLEQCIAISKSTGKQCGSPANKKYDFPLCAIHTKDLEHYGHLKYVDGVISHKYGLISQADVSWIETWDACDDIAMDNTEFATQVALLKRKRQVYRAVLLEK